jgi:DNA-binding FrmR family transcriptional regulator
MCSALYCIDILTQVQAIRAALAAVLIQLLERSARWRRACVRRFELRQRTD